MTWDAAGSPIVVGPLALSGTIAPTGSTTGALAESGNLTLGSTAIFGVNAGSASIYSAVNVSGTATFSPSTTLQVTVLGSSLHVGDQLTILTATSVSWSGAPISETAVNNSNYVFSVAVVNGNSIVLTVTSAPALTNLDVTGGAVTFQAAGSAADTVSVSIVNTAYTGNQDYYLITDPADPITLSANAIAAGWTLTDANGSANSNDALGPVSGISSLFLGTSAGADIVSGIAAGSADVTVSGSGTLDVTGAITTSGNVSFSSYVNVDFEPGVTASGPSSVITISGVGSISDDAGDTLTAATVNLAASSSIGTLAHPILTNAATITVTAGSADAFVTQTTGSASFTATATGGTSINLADTDPTGTLTIGGATSSVSGDITLTAAGNMAINASVTSTSGNITIVAGGAISGDADIDAGSGTLTLTAPLTITSVTPPPATEGISTGTVTVAAFTDGAGNYSNSSDLSATITWGDGVTTAGTVVPVAGSPGSYTVTGSYTYSEEINTPADFTVTVYDTDGASDSSTTTTTVADAPLTITSVTPPAATEGVNTGTVTVAAFSDAAGIYSNSSDLTATITWGDGVTTAGTVVPVNGSPGSYTVTGSYTYSEEIDIPADFTVTVYDVGGASDSSTTTTTVAGASLAPGTITAIGGVEYTTPTTLSATFTDPNVNAPTSDFSGTIQWGDGETTPFTSSAVSGSGGSYTVSGSHQYAEEGSYDITVAINDIEGSSTTDTGSTTVADAPLAGSNAATALGGVEGVTVSTLTNATFTDANLAAPASDFTTSINWGDGSAPDPSAVVSGSDGSYSVADAHQYAEEGTYNFTITITDAGGSTTTITGTAMVAVAPLVNGQSIAVGAVTGVSFANVPVATFQDSGVPESTTDYAATITWGDSSSSAGNIVYTSATQTFTVLGSHTYATSGTFPISIQVTHETAAPLNISGSYATTSTTVWVNDNWADTANNPPQFGDTVTAPLGESAPGATTLVFGVNAFDGQQDTYGMQAALTAAPPNGTVNVLPGTYAGSATTNQPFTLTVSAGVAAVNGNLGGAFMLNKAGNGTLALSGTNSYADGTNVSHGHLQVSADANLGDAAGDVTVTTPGVLEIAGSMSSSRTFYLNNNATLQVDSGKTFTLMGGQVDGGFLTGPGAVQTLGATPTSFNGAQTTTSLTFDGDGDAQFTNFSNGGTMNLGAGHEFDLSQFTNTASGMISVSGLADATDFVSNGQITVNAGGAIDNVGSSGLTFGGGSVTDVLGPSANGMSLIDFNDPDFSTFGFVDLGAANSLLAGGLMVNDGLVLSSTYEPTVYLEVSYGSLLKGYGFAQFQTVNGGVFLPGHSPGSAYTSAFNVNPGGTLQIYYSDATGTAGSPDGWGEANVEPNLFSNGQATLDFTATPSAPFNIQLVTVVDAPPYDSAGAMANFDPFQSYQWRIVAADNPADTVTGTFNAADFNIETTGVANATDGTFSVEFMNNSLYVFYTPAAPPPSIVSVVINEDIGALFNAAGQPAPGVQRSMVNDVVYTFTEPVNIVSPSMDANVFNIAIASGWSGTVPTLNWAPVAGTNDMEWAVNFTGSGVTGGSIANGAYTITVNDPSAITAVSDNQALSLAASGSDAPTQSFYRLYGDINGDELVNAADNLKFKQALTTYNAAFDFNDDGIVNAADNLKFKADLTVGFSGFTPTI